MHSLLNYEYIDYKNFEKKLGWREKNKFLGMLDKTVIKSLQLLWVGLATGVGMNTRSISWNSNFLMGFA